MGILLTIAQLGSLVTSFIVPSIEAAMKIRSLFNLDPSFTVNLYTLTGSALTADDATMQLINDWRKSKGLDPLPVEVVQPITPGTAVSMPVLIMGQLAAQTPPGAPAPDAGDQA